MKPTLMSVCVPYWERQAALDRMFANYAELYDGKFPTDLNLEYSVCDDGSPTQPAIVPTYCILTRLPKKNHPLNPCVPINAAVAAATGDIVVLTNPEVEHLEPVLHEMRGLLGAPQDKHYVIARCREKVGGGWIAGPDVDYTKAGREPVPPGGHFHYLAMCWRQLWNRAGGFDEDYRMGQACDDNDWLWRLWRAGATFVTTQGVVWHHGGERLKWKLPHNRALLRQKWPQVKRLDRKRKKNASDDRGQGVPGERPEVQLGTGERGIHDDGMVSVPRDAQPESGGYGEGAAGSGNASEIGRGAAGGSGGLVAGPVASTTKPSRDSVSIDASTRKPYPVPGVPNTSVNEDGGEPKRRRDGLLHPEWALILGGGELVWEEVLAWEEMYGRQWDGLVIAANDVGSHWPRYLDHWCTLHPDRMIKWRQQRTEYGFPDSYETWGRQGRHADHVVRPWAGGASGMLAIQVAAILGCRRAVLCGIPMTPTPHFTESIIHAPGRPWTSVAGHWRAWNIHLDKVAGWVRSMSGRTQEVLGTPTLAWLREEDGAEETT